MAGSRNVSPEGDRPPSPARRRSSIAASLGLLGLLLLAPAPTSSAPAAPHARGLSQAVTLEPVADATIANLVPDANLGGEQVLEVKRWSALQIRHSLIRFNLAAAVPPEALIERATLRMEQEGWSGETEVGLRMALIAEDWVESEVTWNGRPATGEPELVVASAAAQAPVDFDVTEIVRAWHNLPHYGLEIAGPGDETVFGRVFGSREQGDHPPRLEVVYRVPQPAWLEGRVLEGSPGEEGEPLPGVVVELRCSDEPGEPGERVGDTLTDDAGAFGLQAAEPCPYYNLIEEDPTGYHSAGAASEGGRVIHASWIQYEAPLEGKELAGNRFWDLPAPRPTDTPTPTATGPGSATPSRTATSTVSPSPTASPTSPTATATAPATVPATDVPQPPVWDFEGRVLDPEDQPVAGIELRLLGGQDRARPGARLDWAATDDEGRFRLHYEPPGGRAAAFPVLQVALPAAGLQVVGRASESGGLAGEGDWLDFLEAPGGTYGGNVFRVDVPFPSAAPLRLCASADAWIGQDDPSANHGRAGTLRTGFDTRAGAAAYRSLMRFDLSGLPEDLSLQKAELEMRQLEAGGADPVELQVAPLTQRWSEDTVTWDDRPGQAAEPVVVAPVSAGTGTRRFDVSEIVRGWRDGTLPSLGLVVQGPEDGAEWWRTFESRENPQAPRLALHAAQGAAARPPSAPQGRARIELAPGRGPVGGTFWVRGFDLPPATRLSLHWDQLSTGAALATVTPDALGSFGVALQVPADAAAGQHPLLLFDVDPIEQTDRLLAQASLLVEPPCWRSAPPLGGAPAIALSPSQGPSNGGNTVQVAGTGWRAGAAVRLYWDDPALCATLPSTCLGQATADAGGSFLASVQVPTIAAGEDHQVIARTADGEPLHQQALAAYRMVEPPSVPVGDTQAPGVFVRHELMTLYDGGPPVGIDFVAEAFDPPTSPSAYNGVVRVEVWAVGIGGAHPVIHKKCTVTGWTPRLACLHVENGPFDASVRGFDYWALAEDRSGNTLTSPVKRAWLIDRGPDADDDGLSDAVEQAMCTDPNDPDTDRDNLLDGWEVKGYGFPGGGYVDLPSMGAHPCQPDVFVELDWVAGRQPVPSIDLQPVINAYRDHGVRLHVDHGQWGGGEEVTDTASTALQSHFDPERYWSFHYLVYRPGKSLCWRGKIAYVGDPAGAQRAQTTMHELGHCIGFGHGGLSGPDAQRRSGTAAQRAAWGFRWLYYEQDSDATNNKPNYLSVMSYAWNGLVWLADAGAGAPGFVFRYDYSEKALPDQDERALDERATSPFVQALRAYPLPPRTPEDGRVITMYGCQDPDDRQLYIMATDGHELVGRFRRGDSWPDGWQFQNLPAQDGPGIDWDCDGAIEESVQANINGFSGEGHIHAPSDTWTPDELLSGADDWARMPSLDPCLGDTALGTGFLRAAHDPPCESKGWLPASAVAYPPDLPPWAVAPPTEYCNGADDDGDGLRDEGCLDGDEDGVVDDIDNCPEVANGEQRDRDGDGIGDACAGRPPAPEGLTAALEGDALVLRWSPVPGARGYVVERWPGDGSDPRYLGEGWPSTDVPALRDPAPPDDPVVYRVRTVSRYGHESENAAEVAWRRAGFPVLLPWVLNRAEAGRVQVVAVRAPALPARSTAASLPVPASADAHAGPRATTRVASRPR